MDLGKMLNYAQRYNLHTIPSKECDCPAMSYHSNVVAIGNFRMQSHSHSTGNSVRVYIVGADEPYEIINGTYWTSPGYNFNEFKREHGAWDGAFRRAKQKLRKSIEQHKIKAKQAKQEQEKKRKRRADNRKLEVEGLFVD